MPGFPIRIFPDQSLLTAPRDFSQSSTSFIGNIRLGIHCVPLSTFLCIDLTSNWKIPTTCRQSLKNFLTSKLSKNLCLTLEGTFTRNVVAPLLLSSFPILPPQLAFCKVVSRCYFCDKKTSYDLLFYHTSPEVLLNIRLTVSYYTPHPRLLQEILLKIISYFH